MSFFLLRKEIRSVATLMCTSADKFVGKCYMPWKINTDNIACVQCRSEKACFWWHVFLQPCRRWDFCCHRTWIVQVRGWGAVRWGGVGGVGWGGLITSMYACGTTSCYVDVTFLHACTSTQCYVDVTFLRACTSTQCYIDVTFLHACTSTQCYIDVNWCNVLARLHI